MKVLKVYNTPLEAERVQRFYRDLGITDIRTTYPGASLVGSRFEEIHLDLVVDDMNIVAWLMNSVLTCKTPGTSNLRRNS